MVTLTKVVIDNLYETIHSFVESNKVIIEDYEGMVQLIIRMIKDGHCFTVDRDILRDAMESLTYMYAPSDEMNKDRLIQQFVDDEDDDDDDDSDGSEEGGEFGNMDMLKMMQMMGGMPPGASDDVVVNKEGSNDGANDDANDDDSKVCPATGECCKEACSKDECSKEEPLIPAENVD
jgi:hypothetical protein